MNRFLLLLVAVTLATLPVHAQDWAKARLEKSPRHQEWVKIKQGDREVQTFVVYPEVKDKATAVVLIHEIFGLSDWMRSMADELAEAGYIAIAPDLLSGVGPNGGGTAALGAQDAVVRAIGDLKPDQVSADLNAAVAYASALPSCNGKVAVAGFCWGGGQAFRLATNNKDIKAAFVFYGPGPDDEGTARIAAPVYGFYGGNDNRISATVPATKERMAKAGKTYDPVIYDGAGHGFMRAGEQPGATDANKKARDEGFARLVELLKKL